MDFDSLIGSFARALKMEEVNRTGEDEYRFVFDGFLEVLCTSEGRDSMIIHGPVATLPGSEREQTELLKKLLKGNMALQNEGSGEVVGLDPKTDEVVLFRVVDLEEMTLEAFLEIMGGYLNHLESWKKAIASLDRASPSPSFFIYP